MKKLLVTTVLALVMALHADAAKESGAYAGIGIGPTAYADDDLVKDIHLLNGNNYVNLDENDAGAVIFGGYQFNKIIGVEGSIIDFGEFTSSRYSQHMRALNVSVNAGYDLLNGQLRPFGLLGLGIVDVDVTKNLTTLSGAEGTTLGFHMGFGVDYQPEPLKGVGFRAAYQSDSYIVTLTNLFGYENDYGQTVGILYAGAFYQF